MPLYPHMHWFIFVLLFFSTAPHAQNLQGHFVPGGFAFGQTNPSTSVVFDGAKVPVSKAGDFIIGFHRFYTSGTLVVGNKIIPITVASRTYETQHVVGVPQKTVEPNKAEQQRAAADNAAITKARQPFTDLPYFAQTFTPPIKNPRITGVYGSRRTFNGQERSWHKGHDFAAKTGTPVYAPANGIVRLARNTFFSGNFIIIDHGQRFFTGYAHLHKMKVKAGQKINQGDIIGTVGTTGRSTGPHLHWALYWGNTALDPAFLLKNTN